MQISPNILNVVSILYSFGIAVFGYRYLKKPAPDTELSNIPNFLISLGIFGTFLGIFLGLLNFNPNEIGKSVPGLIGGMKLAFASSVVGLFFALLIKWKILKNSKIKDDKELTDTEVLNIENIFKAILSIQSSLLNADGPYINQFNKFQSNVDDNILRISKAISGDDDSSLVTQIKLFRGESRDELNKLNTSVENFYQEIANRSTDLLLETLRGIVEDFNVRLNEQFGDNFRQLNEAVGRILIWQESYMQQLNEMIEVQGQTTRDMASASNSFGLIIERATALTNVANEFQNLMAGLNTLLVALEQQREEANRHLHLFAEISERARDGLPQLGEQIREITGNLTHSIEESNNQINDHIRETITATNEHNQRLTDLMNRSNEELNNHLNRATENSSTQIEQLDRALKDQLAKSLQSIGDLMAQLSEKFAKDYGPITENLRNLLTQLDPKNNNKN